MLIQSEKEKDIDSVFALNVKAFETLAEAKLVDILREQADPVISLVCEYKLEIVGHIMFSPVILSGHPDLKVMGLLPLRYFLSTSGKVLVQNLLRQVLSSARN